jgi:hypothetical protein
MGTGAARARADARAARADMRGNALSWRATRDTAQLNLAVQARDTARQFEIGAVLLDIGERASKAQARRVHELRGGNPPSATSIDDAAADACASIVAHVRRLDKLTVAHWQSARVLRVLRLYAARGAFLSLATWSGAGLTGDNTGAARFNGALVESLTVDFARHLASGGDDAEPFEHDTRARRAVVRWVFRVGLYDFARALPSDMQAGARARACKQARARCRVLGSVIMGATFDDATLNAGFSSLKNFAESCKAASLFEALRNARAAAVEDCGAVEFARVGAARWRIAAGAAWRKLAHLQSALAMPDTGDTIRRAPGAHKRGRAGIRATLAARSLARRHAVEAFNHALALRDYWRKVEQRAAAANLRAFDMVFARRVSDMRDSGTVARFDDLLHVAGLRDSLGRVRGGGKLDGAMVTRARGKVATRRADGGTVKLTVGRARRALPCALLAPAGAGDIGATLARQLSAPAVTLPDFRAPDINADTVAKVERRRVRRDWQSARRFDIMRAGAGVSPVQFCVSDTMLSAFGNVPVARAARPDWRKRVRARHAATPDRRGHYTGATILQYGTGATRRGVLLNSGAVVYC